MIQFLSPEEDDEKARFWFANLLQLHAAAPNELELLHNSTLYRSSKPSPQYSLSSPMRLHFAHYYTLHPTMYSNVLQIYN
ncbi:hypothetical protein V6N12_054123 [Hibiscus sabdariffa]|uniref:Uncharacterized protein n=1 Tax=Hibiscus sabdariffa TaxID=183260 RepID=A0ABR2B7G3_9ROSI